MNTLLIIIASIGILIFVVTSIMIVDYLNNKGEKVNFLLLRLYIIPYANKYAKMTKKEAGKTGHLFYAWIISINTALACVILLYLINR